MYAARAVCAGLSLPNVPHMYVCVGWGVLIRDAGRMGCDRKCRNSVVGALSLIVSLVSERKVVVGLYSIERKYE